MADSVVVVNSALCFLKNKFGKINVKLLKSALLDFYDVRLSLVPRFSYMTTLRL